MYGRRRGGALRVRAQREEEGKAERQASFLEREWGRERKLAGNFPPILIPPRTWSVLSLFYFSLYYLLSISFSPFFFGQKKKKNHFKKEEKKCISFLLI